MRTSTTEHPASNGLCDSGRVVSLVRPETPVTAYVHDTDDMISVALPGNPCEVLLGFSVTTAEDFMARLRVRVDEVRARQGQGGM